MEAKIRHTCGGPAFGRLTAGCPRCDELAAGAPARAQPFRERYARQRAADERARASHYAPGGAHATGACGPVCTAFDW
jgi:hypothetical protein